MNPKLKHKYLSTARSAFHYVCPQLTVLPSNSIHEHKSYEQCRAARDRWVGAPGRFSTGCRFKAVLSKPSRPWTGLTNLFGESAKTADNFSRHSRNLSLLAQYSPSFQWGLSSHYRLAPGTTARLARPSVQPWNRVQTVCAMFRGSSASFCHFSALTDCSHGLLNSQRSGQAPSLIRISPSLWRGRGGTHTTQAGFKPVIRQSELKNALSPERHIHSNFCNHKRYDFWKNVLNT